MKDDPVKVCPECAGNVKRLLYPVGIVFKGSGWYINDSRKPDTAENGASIKTDTKDGAGKPAESKSDAKTEAKSESKTEAAPSAATT